jgi:hypothetical protein
MLGEITPEMAGTWLSGWWGWRNAYRVIDRAVEYGFTVPDEYAAALAEYRDMGHATSEDNWEAINGQGELSDQATEYLQSLASEGYVFVWDAGELSLMTEADAENL